VLTMDVQLASARDRRPALQNLSSRRCDLG